MLVSIITVNLNDRVGLERTCASVFKQSFTDYEQIIIDGASVDGSLDYIETHNDKFSYWISEPDSGVYCAMNKGIRQAKGKYLLFLNSGDILCNDKVLSDVKPALGNDIGFIYGNLRIEGENGESFINKYPEVLDFNFFKTTSLGHASTFIKRSLFGVYGEYRTDLKIVSDWAFFLSAICIEKLSYLKIDKTISIFYEGGLSTSSTYDKLHKEERKNVLLENFDLYEQGYNELLDEYRKFNIWISLINDKLPVVVSNRYTLKIVNFVISLLGGILIKKRQ